MYPSPERQEGNPFEFKRFEYTPEPRALYQEAKRYLTESLGADLDNEHAWEQAFKKVQSVYRPLYQNALDLSDEMFANLLHEMKEHDSEVAEHIALKRDAQKRQKADEQARAETFREEW